MTMRTEAGEDLVRRIERLEAIEEIKQLKSRYARACDPRHDVETLLSLFTDDAVFSVERFGRYEGKAAIREFLEGADDIVPWALHYMIAPVVEVSDDRRSARGTWYLWEPAKMPRPPRGDIEAFWIAGVYEDELVRESDGWRFKSVS
ncbi:MAG: nuclear transport factor 2 family protein, partial [Candidatus Binatia bacterium]